FPPDEVVDEEAGCADSSLAVPWSWPGAAAVSGSGFSSWVVPSAPPFVSSVAGAVEGSVSIGAPSAGTCDAVPVWDASGALSGALSVVVEAVWPGSDSATTGDSGGLPPSPSEGQATVTA